MPPLKDVTTMVTAARSRSIRFTFIIQNFAQLNEVYGKEDAETIRSNCGNLIYLLTTELAALEEISKLCGEVKSKEKDKTASTPLITVSDLQKLKMNEVIIIHSRLHPFRNKLKPSYEIDWGDSGFGKGELIEREKRPIDLFDVKEFVKVKKRNKLFEALDNKDNKETNESGVRNIEPVKDNVTASPTGLFNETKDSRASFDNVFNPFNASPLSPESNIRNSQNSLYNSNNLTASSNKIEKFDDLMKEENNDPIETLSDYRLPEFDLSMHDNKPIEKNIENKTAEPKFDIDSIVKRIDAKIAELEAQQKLEEEQNGLNSNEVKISEPTITNELESEEAYEKLDNTIIEKFDDFIKNQEEEKSEPIVNIDNDSVVVGDVTDDQYFDDFFNED